MFGISQEAIDFGVKVETIHAITFVFFTALFLAFDKIPAMDKYRIRPKVKQDPKLTQLAIKNIVMSHVLAVPYLAGLVFPIFQWRGMTQNSMPSLMVAVSQIFFSMLVEDTLFYWIHRILHHPRLYKHLHKQHHLYINTVSYAAEFSHPIEQTVSNVFPSYAGPILCNMSIDVFCIWTFLRLWETFESHSGFVLPYSPWEFFLSVQGGAARHDFHHSHNKGSFGSLFKFWDWFMGTDADFKAFQKLQQQKKDHQAQHQEDSKSSLSQDVDDNAADNKNE